MTLYPAPDPAAIPLHLLSPESCPGWLERQDEATRAWVGAMGFVAGLGDLLCLPATDGTLRGALLGWGTPEARARDRFHLAGAAERLPAGRYALAAEGVALDAGVEALGWCLAGYRFGRYREGKAPVAELVCPDGVDFAASPPSPRRRPSPGSSSTPRRATWGRRRSRRPVAFGAAYGAAVAVIGGEELLSAANLPMIDAVGARRREAPRLLHLSWGREDAPKVALVGKGVCSTPAGSTSSRPPACG